MHKHIMIILQTGDNPTNNGSTTLHSTTTHTTVHPVTPGTIVPISDTSNPFSLSFSFTNGTGVSFTNGTGVCPCTESNCTHYQGIPYPNLLGRNIQVDCCCDSNTLDSSTIQARVTRIVTYTPCTNPDPCDCNLPLSGSYCSCPGFSEEFSGSGNVHDGVVLHGTVTIGTCPQLPYDYTIFGTMGCGGGISLSDPIYFPGSYDSQYVSGSYTVSCNQFTMQWTYNDPGAGVKQEVYINFTMSHNNARCCASP